MASCTMGTLGCTNPRRCDECGFERTESARRKALPLETGPDGLRRKVIRRKKEEEEA